MTNPYILHIYLFEKCFFPRRGLILGSELLKVLRFSDRSGKPESGPPIHRKQGKVFIWPPAWVGVYRARLVGGQIFHFVFENLGISSSA